MTTTTPTNIWNEVNETINAYDPDMFIGRVVWYTISEDVNVSHEDFVKALLAAFEPTGITPHLPNNIRPRDVFKRACKYAKRTKVPGQDSYFNYTLRPAGHDADNVWRVIVREEVDSAGHKLSYDELCRVRYNAVDNQIAFEDLTDIDLICSEVKQDIRAYFTNWADRLTAYAIREYVRKYLDKKLYAIRVRPSGGIYFVTKEYATQVEAIATVINNMGGTSTFHQLPLVDDGRQREMLRAAFEDESVGECQRLIGEMADIINSDKKITADTWANYKAEYDAMRKKVVDYSDLLDEKMGETAMSLEIVKKTMTKLMTSIK